MNRKRSDNALKAVGRLDDALASLDEATRIAPTFAIAWNNRAAVLRALLNATNSGVRIEALRLIEPVKADGSVRGVLMALAAKDQSQYIKSQARTMLAQLPEID